MDQGPWHPARRLSEPVQKDDSPTTGDTDTNELVEALKNADVIIDEIGVFTSVSIAWCLVRRCGFETAK